MKQQSKLSQQQQHTEQQSSAHETQKQGKEFASADEMLRFDAANTIVPPEIAERLKQSAGNLPPAPRRSWWRNLFGK